MSFASKPRSCGSKGCWRAAPRPGRSGSSRPCLPDTPAGEPLGTSDARLLPGRASGRGAELVPASQGDPGGRAGHRPLPGAREASRTGPEARSRTRSARRAPSRLPAPGEDRRRPHWGRIPRDPATCRTGRGRQDLPRRHRRQAGVRPSLRPGCAGHRRTRASAHRPDLRLLAGAGSCLHRFSVPARRESSSHRGERGARWSETGPFASSSKSLWRSRSPTAKASLTGTSDRPTSSSTWKGTPISGTS